MSVFIDNIPHNDGNFIIVDGYMYICNGNGISKISMTDPHDRDDSWEVGFPYFCIAYWDGYLYGCKNFGDKIRKINIANPTIRNNSWRNNPGLFPVLYFNENYLYISYTTINNTFAINRINLINNISNQLFSINQSQVGWGLIAYYGYLYVTFYNNKSICRISLTNPQIYNINWVTTLPKRPVSLIIANGYLYVNCYNDLIIYGYTISKISLTDPINDSNFNWLTVQNYDCYFLFYYDDYIYIDNLDNKDYEPNYVTRVLADPPIALFNPKGLLINNGYFYVANLNNTINKINTSNLLDFIVYTYYTNYISLVTFNGYLYAANNNSIIRIDLSNPTIVVSPWPSQGVINALSLNGSGWVATDGNYLYITNNNSISRISLTNPTIEYTSIWFNINNPTGMTVYNGYLYACTSDNKIYRIRITDKSYFFWDLNLQGLDNPKGITNDGTYIYVANYNNNTISIINITATKAYTAYYTVTEPALDGPFGLTMDNGYLYITNYISNTISQISSPIDNLPFNNPRGIINTNGYFYVASNNIISKINIINQTNKTNFIVGNYTSLVYVNDYIYMVNNNSIIQTDTSVSIINYNWPSQGVINALSLNGSGWVASDGNYLYVTNNNSISRISLTVPNLDYDANWVSINNPTGMTVYNGYLYACTSDNKIYRISLTNKSIFTWATNMQGLNNPQGIVNDGKYLYVANYTTNRICQISITNPNINYNISWANISNGLNGPFGLTTYNGYLYASNSNNNTITQLDLPIPPVPPTPPTPPAPTPPYVIDDAMESCLIDTPIISCNTICKPSYRKFVTSGNDPSISKAMLVSMRIRTAKRNNCNVVNYVKNDSSCY